MSQVKGMKDEVNVAGSATKPGRYSEGERYSSLYLPS
jgi:hypothetical protein